MPKQIVNIASYLVRSAQERPNEPALYFPHGSARKGQLPAYRSQTFAELDRASNDMARGLKRVGITRGGKVALMVGPSPEFFALAFAIFKVGAVPVIIDPGIGLKNLKTCLAEAAPQAFIGIPKAQAARLLLGWARDAIKTVITVGRRLFWGGYTLFQISRMGSCEAPFTMADTTADEMAAILFTSGSTGIPKGVVYRHGNFQAQVEALRELLDIKGGEMNLPTFPPFALFDPALGMTSIIPHMDPTRPAHVDPVKIIGAVKKFRVNIMFGSPALLNTVGRYGEAHGVKLPSLKRVISAGAPVPAPIQRRFLTILGEDGEVFPSYGATESLPVSAMSSHDVIAETWPLTERGKGVCVGKPVSTIDVRIIPITDDAIETWAEVEELGREEIGEIAVSGPMVTDSYYRREESTRLAKIRDEQGHRFFHRMGDLGYVDRSGRLWFCGRKTHRVQSANRTYYTVPCEGVFNAHPAVYRTALVGVQNAGQIKPVICVELEHDRGVVHDPARVTNDLKRIAREHAHTKEIDTFLYHPGFPVDIRHNTKIGREILSAWAQKELS